jgi:hypothetical protein
MTKGIVTVKVGTDSVEFHVHKALLVRHSEYFKNALNGSWEEAKENVVTLDDVDSGTCALSYHFSRIST